MTNRTIGILGLGRMGEAVARAALLATPTGDVHVTRRSAARSAELAKMDPRIKVSAPEEIVAACEYIVLALGPDAARNLLPGLGFRPNQHLISVMAEVGHEDLQGLTAGAGSVARVLTLPSVANGGQLLPCFRVNAAARHLLGANNTLHELDTEAALMTIWTITGMISATMMVPDVCAHWLQDSGVDGAFAQAYARSLFAEAQGVTADGFAAGMEHVSTPGGLNAMVHDRLCKAGVEEAVRDSLNVVHQRLIKTTGT